MNFLLIIKEYGLWAVFIGTFFEGEFVLITAGILAGEGMLNPAGVWVSAFLGAWTGHVFWFLMGRMLGARRILPKLKKYENQVAEVNRIILNHPKTAIFSLQYLYGMRVVGAVGFGITDLSFVKFLFYEAINCMIWAVMVLSAGWIMGETFVHIFRGWLRWVWIGLSLLLFVLFFHHLKVILQSKTGSNNYSGD